jgi:hypothetical protein
MRTLLHQTLLTLLACLGLPLVTHATDLGGVLPNANTADGIGVLVNLNNGVWNSGFGFQALNQDTNGSFNTGVGVRALFFDRSGSRNTAVGVYSLFNNSTGNFNTAVGSNALQSNNASFNTAVGWAALTKNAVSFNTAVGWGALFSNTTGNTGTAVGYRALASNTTSGGNTAVGSEALAANTSGDEHCAFGFHALFSNTTSTENSAFGFRTLEGNTTGSQNTAVGEEALLGNTTGNHNTALGVSALGSSVSGDDNIAIGFSAGTGVTSANDVIAIGHAGANVSGTCFIDNIRGVTTQNANAVNVVIDSAGQLGTVSSSRRYKDNIEPMDKASEALLALRPVTFNYKSDKTNTPQFGLIAEDVAEVNPDLVVRDKNGEIYSVRYDAVNAMLLNEFLKEHKRVQKQGRELAEQKSINADLRSALAQQQKAMKALVAQVQEQNAKIERVSAQIATSRPAPQLAENR